MNTNDLAYIKSIYKDVVNSNDFEIQMGFAKALSKISNKEAIEYHFHLLKNDRLGDLYLYLRDTFSQRKDEATINFLIHQLETCTDVELRADSLLILGFMNARGVENIARRLINDPFEEMKDNACSVLGWSGQMQDINTLGKLLTEDTSWRVRCSAAGAISQILDRFGKSRPQAFAWFRRSLEAEGNQDVIRWVIYAIQEATGRSLGVTQDEDSGDLVGDPNQSKIKALKFLSS